MKAFLRRWGLLTVGVTGYWAFALFHAISVYNFISTHGAYLADLAVQNGGIAGSPDFIETHEAPRIAIGTLGQYGFVFVLMMVVLLIIRWLLNASRHMPETRGRFH